MPPMALSLWTRPASAVCAHHSSLPIYLACCHHLQVGEPCGLRDRGCSSRGRQTAAGWGGGGDGAQGGKGWGVSWGLKPRKGRLAWCRQTWHSSACVFCAWTSLGASPSLPLGSAWLHLPSHRPPIAAPQPKAARQAGPVPEIQAGAGQPVADGVTRQKVLQPHRKAMEPASMVDISQVCEGAGTVGLWGLGCPLHTTSWEGLSGAGMGLGQKRLEGWLLRQPQAAAVPFDKRHHNGAPCCLPFPPPQQGQRAEDVLMPSAAVQVAPELADAVAARQAQWAQQGAAPPAGQQQQQGEGEGAAVEPYLVPACAAWFRWDAIADVEEAHFRDFLAADPANPERYREYRNATINKYRWVLRLGVGAPLAQCGGRWCGEAGHATLNRDAGSSADAATACAAPPSCHPSCRGPQRGRGAGAELHRGAARAGGRRKPAAPRLEVPRLLVRLGVAAWCLPAVDACWWVDCGVCCTKAVSAADGSNAPLLTPPLTPPPPRPVQAADQLHGAAGGGAGGGARVAGAAR